MNTKHEVLCALVLSFTVGACSGSPAPQDAGDTGAVTDTSSADTGGGQDVAATDAATDATTDAVTPADTGGADGATDDAGGGPPDAGMEFMALAPCNSASDYRTGDAVNFDSDGGNAYSPACLRVRAGTTVTIQASATHPLAPSLTRGTTPSPITPGVAPQSITFTTAGFYPFFCTNHGAADGTGMAGVVHVTPAGP